MTSSNRAAVLALIVFFFIPIVFLQKTIDPERDKFDPYSANKSAAMRQLPIEFALGAASGFSQAIAGLLWVRTDEFFDQGEYDAIIPMVRIITWLDPHNIDVYETGAWHLDYNFTDTDQRSDRRYIPVSIALLEEGIANNPSVSELYSDLAFTHYYRKIGDYPKSAYWFERAEKIPGWDVTKVGHGLAHAYTAEGQIQKAIDQWKYCISMHEQRINETTDPSLLYSEKSSLQVAIKNLIETEGRNKWRPTQTQPPYNVGFTATLTRIAPMVFVVAGTFDAVGSQPGFNFATGKHTWGPADGNRIDVRLQDANYDIPDSTKFVLGNNISNSITIMQDAISVRQGKFQKKIDMSLDHLGDQSMYSFTAPLYTVEVWYNPANPESTPINVADRFGWIGEGVTDSDSSLIDTSGRIPATSNAVIPGLKIIKKTFTLTRDDIMGTDVKVFN
jgi:tetratricopeptide (TPR) repeat protein